MRRQEERCLKAKSIRHCRPRVLRCRKNVSEGVRWRVDVGVNLRRPSWASRRLGRRKLELVTKVLEGRREA
jgi:hypothetical protein